MIYNMHLEQNVIGGIFCLRGFGDAVEAAISSLSIDDFYDQSHKKIYSAIIDCKKRGVAPDVNAVSDHRFCEEHFSYCLELARNTVSGINLVKHSESLRKISELRKTQNRVNEINEIISSNIDLDEKINEIEQLFDLEIGFSGAEIGAKHISSCMPSYVDSLEQRWENPESIVFTTGIRDLDNIFGGGLEIGLHAIAARPKMGKTELMTKMINHFAVDRGLPVYVGSLEMSSNQVIERLVSSFGRVGKTQIKNNFKDEQDYDLAIGAFTTSCGHVGNSDIYIDDRSNNTVRGIRREALKIQKKHGKVGGIFVDYLGLLDSEGRYDRHDLSIAAMTKALKGMSKEFSCPVVMLLQLNRALESRQDKRPMPSDARDSGAIEQDVDSFTVLYRDSVYYEDSPWESITEIIVRLNRHGETGTAYQVLTGHGFVDISLDQVAAIELKAVSKPGKSYGKKTTEDF